MTDPNDKKTEQTNRDGSTGFQTTVHGGTVNIGSHYHSAASPKPGSVDFERYIQFIRQDSRYQNVRDLYTETEALIPLEAETVERQSKRSEQDTEQAQKKVERFPVLEGLRKYALGRERQHVLLAGRPGSGKSTTLKRLLLELADEWVADSTQPVPIYIQLKRDSSPLELITDELEKGDIELEEKEIKRLLRRKRLILLLDGINEIPSEPRRRKLQEFREDHPTTPMIFTTRDLSVGGDLLGIKKRLEMLLLSAPQMRQFVGKYLSDRGMSGQTDTLLRQLHDRLREIAETPLLLEMLCDVFDPAIQQIPQSKGELFRQFDEKYDTFKGDPAVSEDSRRYRKELLRHLAFCMMQGPLDKPTEAWLTLDRNLAEKILENYLTGHVHDSGPRAREWLEDLLEHHLLQIAANPREIEFHHQLFQEYYAAEELLLRLPDLLENEPKFERDYLNLLKWTEPIALMLALMNEEKQALRVVKLAIDDVDLMLGAKLAGKLQPLSQKEAIANVIEKIRTKVTSPSCKIKLLGQTCSDYAVPILIEKLTTEKNQDLIFEAAFALKELGCRSAVQQLLPLLKHNHQLIVIAALFVLGELGGKNILPDICEALNHSEEESIREYAVEALGKLGDRTIISHLISSAKKDPSIGVREKAVEALLRLHAESALTTLIEIVSENKNISVSNLSSCWSAAKTLDQNDLENAVQALAEIIRNETDHDTRQNLVEAIGVI
ncbi:HEAT repeat domain-containing protein, partial [Leptolyngbya cf. ectocarpi LEGE 11479]